MPGGPAGADVGVTSAMTAGCLQFSPHLAWFRQGHGRQTRRAQTADCRQSYHQHWKSAPGGLSVLGAFLVITLAEIGVIVGLGVRLDKPAGPYQSWFPALTVLVPDSAVRAGGADRLDWGLTRRSIAACLNQRRPKSTS